MSWSNASKVWQLTSYWAWDKGGTSEKLYLKDNTISTLITNAEKLLGYRLGVAPGSQVLVYAKLSQVGNPRDRRIVFGPYPKDGTWLGEGSGSPVVYDAQTNELNSDEDAVLVQLESADGSWANKYYHGVPDAYAHTSALTAGISIATSTPPSLTAGGYTSATWFERFGMYLFHVKALTAMFRKIISGGATVLQVDDIETATVRKLANKKVGRPFGQPRGRAAVR